MGGTAARGQAPGQGPGASNLDAEMRMEADAWVSRTARDVSSLVAAMSGYQPVPPLPRCPVAR